MSEAVLTSIYGNSVPLDSELNGISGIPTMPAHLARSIIDHISVIRVDDNRDRLYLQLGDKFRIPYDGSVIGVRIYSPYDVTSETLRDIRFIWLKGDDNINSKNVRGRSEQIVASRWEPDNNYLDLLFSSAVSVNRGDQTGMYLQETNDSDINISQLSIAMIGEKSSGTSGVTSSSIFSDASSTFISDGVTSNMWLIIYSGGDNSVYGYHEITSVDSEISLTVNSAFAANSSGYTWSIGRTQPDHGVRLIRSSSDLSGDGPFNFSSSFDEVHESSILNIVPIMSSSARIALVGDSIMAGSNPASLIYGGLQSWPNSDNYSWTLANDIGLLVGQDVISLGVSGKDIEDWVGESIFRITTGGDSEETEVLLVARPDIVVFNTLANDCKKSWNEVTYSGYLDDLKVHTDSIGAVLILTTGTPLEGRDSGQKTKAQDMRGWTRTWCSSNGIRIIETESAMRDTTEDTLPAIYDSGDGIHLSNAGNVKLAELIHFAIDVRLYIPTGILF